MSDADQVKALLLHRVEELARYLFPAGKRESCHWCVGNITGVPGKSFKICIAGEKAGLWGDFAGGEHSRSLLDLWMQARNVDFKTALREAANWLGPSLSGSVLKTPAKSAEAATTPVKPRPLAFLLDAICEFLRRYVVFQHPEQATVCALWVAHTSVIEAFDFSPYLHVFSAERRSGKSRLLDVLELLVNAPWRDGGLTEAVLFRRIKRDLPTLLADEIDTVFHVHKNDGMENIRRMFNLGFTRGYVVSRCVGTNTKFEIEEFDPFCAKALCGIGKCLPDTVSDRCIPIELARQLREEKAARFRKRDAVAETFMIKKELEAWARLPGLIDTLRAARPQMPGELQDRAEEICEPLIAIADMAAGEWAEKARRALIKLCVQDDDTSIGEKLLADIKGIFDSTGADKLPTIDILNALVAIEGDRPWATWWLDDLKHDKPQKPATRLAKLLKPYPVKPSDIRVDSKICKGYTRSSFQKAWARYIPPSEKAATRATAATHPRFTREKAVAPTNKQAATVAPLGKAAATQIPLVDKGNVAPVAPVAPFPDGEEKEPMETDSEQVTTSEPGADKPVVKGEPFTDEEGREWFKYPEGMLCKDAELPAEYFEPLGALVYPFNEPEWVYHKPSGRKQPPDSFPTNPHCEVCGGSTTGEHWWFRIKTKAVHCSDCRETHWWADGYEINDGMPSCWDSSHTREQRIAERERDSLQKHQQYALEHPDIARVLPDYDQEVARLTAIIDGGGAVGSEAYIDV
jgi:hypothetical protein